MDNKYVSKTGTQVIAHKVTRAVTNELKTAVNIFADKVVFEKEVEILVMTMPIHLAGASDFFIDKWHVKWPNGECELMDSAEFKTRFNKHFPYEVPSWEVCAN